MLEPLVPICRVENSSGQSDGGGGEFYTPSDERSTAEAEATQPEPLPNQDSAGEAQPSLADGDPAHEINFFA
jgi:hypothetical protein